MEELLEQDEYAEEAQGPMDDEELIQILRQEAEDAIGTHDSQLAAQRAENMDRYHGMPYGNETTGRSQVISRDATEAVEWAMPMLMDVFFSGDRVVELDPSGPEDVLATELESDYLNYVFLRKNDGFIETYQAVKDVLTQKDGIFKVWVEETSRSSSFDIYENLLAPELEALLQDPRAELVEMDEISVIIDTPEGPQEVPGFDAKIATIEVEKCERVKAIPPEEFRVSRRTRASLQESPYTAHVSNYTKAELLELIMELELDLDVEEVYSSAVHGYLDSSPERLARHQVDGTQTQGHFNVDSEECEVHEEYVRVDANGDGYQELLKIIRVGDYILYREEYSRVPFAHLLAILNSHKFNGTALVDLVNDIAEIKTNLQRNILDNVTRQNNGRTAVLDNQVVLSDLLNSRPGGVVREFVSGAVRPLQEPALSGQVYDLLGYYDQMRDERTGINKVSQGLDPNALTSNVSSGAIGQVMSAAQQRIKLMARMLSQGMKDVFWLLHEVSREEIGTPQRFNFNGKFQEIAPGQMLERKDFSIRVGLGNIERDADLTRLGLLAQDMQLIASQGGVGRLLQEHNVYALAVDRAKAAGVLNPERYFTDPEQLDPPEQQPTEAETDMQMEQMKQQFQAQIKQMELAAKEQIAAREAELKAWELEIAEAELAIEAALEAKQNRGVALGDD